jgi:hypothetical protein
VESETAKFPKCNGEMIAFRGYRDCPPRLACPTCRTSVPMTTTADPLPPPPTRDGDKGGPAMGEAKCSHGNPEALCGECAAADYAMMADGGTSDVVVTLRAERDALTAERDAWKARVQAAEKVIATLPRTADGAAIGLKMPLYREFGLRNEVRELMAHSLSCTQGVWDGVAWSPGSVFYSTRAAAAEAAKEGRVQP